MTIKVYEHDGIRIISRLGSYLAWRRYLGQDQFKPPPRTAEGLCVFCHGFRVVNTVQFGEARCLCDLYDEQKDLEERLRPYRSLFEPSQLETLQPWGDYNHQMFYTIMPKRIQTWIDNPTGWLMFYGSTGTGKTHALSAIATAFGPWALYITASDFEQMIFTHLQDDELNLSEALEAVRRAPILLYDDLGSEFVGSGKDFVRSNLRKVIDFRYKLWEEFPTVVATNLDQDQLTAYDMRIASRVMDLSKVNLANFTGPDWRRHAHT